MKDYEEILELEDLLETRVILANIFEAHRKQSLFTLSVANAAFKDHRVILLSNETLHRSITNHKD